MDKNFADEYSYSIETDYKSSRNHVMLQWTDKEPTERGWYQAVVDGDAEFIFIIGPGRFMSIHGDHSRVRHPTRWLGPIPLAAINEQDVFHSTLSR